MLTNEATKIESDEMQDETGAPDPMIDALFGEDDAFILPQRSREGAQNEYYALFQDLNPCKVAPNGKPILSKPTHTEGTRMWGPNAVFEQTKEAASRMVNAASTFNASHSGYWLKSQTLHISPVTGEPLVVVFRLPGQKPARRK